MIFSMFLDSGPFCVCIHAYELCSHYQYISHDSTCIQVCSYSFSCLSWECQSECRQGWVSPWASAGGLAAGNAMAVPGRPPVIAPRDGEKIEVSILIVLQFSIHSLFNWQWLYTFHFQSLIIKISTNWYMLFFFFPASSLVRRAVCTLALIIN